MSYNFAELEKILESMHRIGSLKFRKREGWLDINIVGESCESIAAHSFRTGIIAYWLAKLNGLEPEKCAAIGFFALIHDLEEINTGDIIPRRKKFLNADRKAAAEDAIADMWLLDRIKEHEDLINDADKLEMVLQAKEYYDIGNRYALDWIKSGKKQLRGTDAKQIAELAETTNSKKWVFRE